MLRKNKLLQSKPSNWYDATSLCSIPVIHLVPVTSRKNRIDPKRVTLLQSLDVFNELNVIAKNKKKILSCIN